ncbi:MAG: hypothetical protein AB7V13_24460 [Pseudorhodoplanes sp.]|uniref:hypothetical protein n=1 Tax=Pseudorhodoplanes sp. TaxID=1934341 RepID=UPI003D11CA07
MQKPINSISSLELRRWAMECYDQAINPRASGEERERLLKMRQSLLTLAEEQDWLNGKAKCPADGGPAGDRVGL